MLPFESIDVDSMPALDLAIEEALREFERTGDAVPLAYAQWPTVLLDYFQQDIVRSMFDPTIRELYVKGCTASGKTSSVALGICLYFWYYPDSKVILTSVTSDHVKTTLFAEVSSWWARMIRPAPGAELLIEKVEASKQHFVICVNPKNPDAFRGKHAPHALFVVDEGSGVPDERYDLIDTQATKLVVMSNPTFCGRFRLAFSLCKDENKNETVLAPYGYRRCLTIDGAECLNVRMKRLESPVAPIGGITLGTRDYLQGERITPEHYELAKPIIPGQLCYDTYMAHCSKDDKRWVGTFAHGKFPKDDPDVQVVLDGWINRHMEAWRSRRPIINAYGLDVAASEHGAETVLAAGSHEGCSRIKGWREPDVMKTVGLVLAEARKDGNDLTRGDIPICVDVDGVGKGVANRLEELGCRVIKFNGGGSPENKDRYGNCRAEAYGELGLRLDPNGLYANTPWALPADDDGCLMRPELCAPEKVYDSSGFRFHITPKTRYQGMPANKTTVSEKLGRSPDRADAVVYLFVAACMVKRTASEGLSVFDIRTAVQLPGPADEVALRGWRENVAAIYQHDPRSPVAFVALGCKPEDQQIGLLLSKVWAHTVPKQQVAREIGAYYQRLNLLGVAFDPSRSFYLADELAILPAKPYLPESPLTPDRRKKIGQLLQWYLPEQRICLYQDERLVNQLIRLPVEAKSDGFVLGDVEAAGGQLEVAVAFSIALYWAHGTMASALKGK